MRTCAQCGATSPPIAAWCGQCYLPFAPLSVGYQAAVGTAGYAVPPGAVEVPTYSWPAPAQNLGLPLPGGPSETPSGWVYPGSAPAGWASPGSSAPSVGQRPPPSGRPGQEGRLLNGRAAGLVGAAIGVGGLLQVVGLVLSRHRSIEPDRLIRYDIVLTLALYVVVGVMIVSQITPSVRLSWGIGPWRRRVAVGASVGVGVSLVLLVLVSVASGHLQSDPRIALLMSEGDPTHIGLTAFISCMAAPLVEEVLFRGLLLESLRPRGRGLAIAVSALAFAAWHFKPASLVYYTVLGTALGAIYLRHGLVGSISAHAGFNGVLTIAAIVMVLGPSHEVSAGALSLRAPSGWSADSGAPGGVLSTNLELVGPADAQLEVIGAPAVPGATAQTTAAQMATGVTELAGVTAVVSTVRVIAEPVGQLAEVNVTADGRAGTIAVLASDRGTYEIVFFGAGSDRAQRDFGEMLSSITLT